MDMNTLRTSTEQDLRKLLKEKQAELGEKNFKLRLGELKNNQSLRLLKREIAQIMTALQMISGKN